MTTQALSLNLITVYNPLHLSVTSGGMARSAFSTSSATEKLQQLRQWSCKWTFFLRACSHGIHEGASEAGPQRRQIKKVCRTERKGAEREKRRKLIFNVQPATKLYHSKAADDICRERILCQIQELNSGQPFTVLVTGDNCCATGPPRQRKSSRTRIKEARDKNRTGNRAIEPDSQHSEVQVKCKRPKLPVCWWERQYGQWLEPN